MIFRVESAKVTLLISFVVHVTIGSLYAAPHGLEKSHQTAQASARIMKELVNIYKSDSYKKGLFQVEPVEDNLYEWDVKLFFAHSEAPLKEDLQRMKELGKGDHIMLRVSFGGDYPIGPPFVRVVYPVMQMGNISSIGSICMYHLSKQGWASDFTMEGILLMILDLLEKNNNRVEFDHTFWPQKEYTCQDVRDQFSRLMKFHEWDHERPQDKPSHNSAS